jgi:hypothetical protein
MRTEARLEAILTTEESGWVSLTRIKRFGSFAGRGSCAAATTGSV